MNATIEKLFTELEKQRKDLFDELAKNSDEVLNRKPSPQAWSAVQVIEHLITSEEASLKYLQKKTLDTSRSKSAGFAGKWRLMLTKLTFVLPFKFKAPETMQPAAGFVTLNELSLKWQNLRGELYKLIGKLTEEELNKELWKNVFSGKMNIYQMLDFFRFHISRHQNQIDRTLTEVKGA